MAVGCYKVCFKVLKFGVVCGVDLKYQKASWKWIVLSASVTASKNNSLKKSICLCGLPKG